ncbi:hypothetical protein AGOR_G00245320 [Albula goreensis]|uniref:Uncharacterized protein n=1 Tax=Albula goreensis TaxID=1534307 RepID=A0A8T3CD22_9TELE|nr:hypothetical protein AGOR_G00245320 [Albula goreensis]
MPLAQVLSDERSSASRDVGLSPYCFRGYFLDSKTGFPFEVHPSSLSCVLGSSSTRYLEVGGGAVDVWGG